MRPLSLAAVLLLAATGALAQGAPQVPARLAGHAVLPAGTVVEPPADAPEDVKVSGKFTHRSGRRTDALGSLKGSTFLAAKEAPRFTGFSLPMRGQPLQGLSGIRGAGEGSYWVLTDNGFGARANSPDALLVFHRMAPNWETGTVAVLQTAFLHDPDRRVPFRIALEGTPKRYLTGGDLDIESIQPVADGFWFGDEFGPYLIKTDRSGKVLAFHESEAAGKAVRSPDHYAVSVPPTPTATAAFDLTRSRGYEGMAQSRDGRFLYPLLEGPLWNADTKEFEKVDGRSALRILEFDVQAGRFTGRHWLYPLEAEGNAIGDLNMIDESTALVIERDNGEGDAFRACPQGAPRSDCFNQPARLKRVYKIELGEANAGKAVRKIAYIDLLAIDDPKSLARQGGANGKLSFPFVTIENVDVVDGERIVVANDNNFPYSAGREPQRQDDNEFILLQTPELLRAR